MQKNYWSKILDQRLSRRRTLAMTGALGASAAFLVACGSDDGPSGNGTGANGNGNGAASLLTQIEDTTDQAVRGGTYVDSHPGVILTHDPMRTGIATRVARRGYSQLFRVAPGYMAPPDGTIEGDLAESWEMSEDGLTLSIKLDPRAGLPPIPPVDGRTVDAQDVVFSWNRLLAEGALRSEIANTVNPGAPVVSIEAPDDQTVVVNLAEPNATIYSQLGTEVLGSLYILPREAEDQFDPAREAIGSGPYYMTESSEVRLRWLKNPNFGRASLTNGEPFIDEILEPVIPDIAQATAQFRAGAIYEYNVQAAELLNTKDDVPELLMRVTDPQITGTERLYFGHAEGSPFRDERVRIAYMKTINRDDFIAAAHNTDRFEEQGLPVETFWEASLAAGSWAGWALDPRDPSFGENAANYEYSLEDARALVEAAGFSTPLEFTQTYAAPGPSAFPPGFYNRADIYLGQVEGSGIFQMNRNLVNYQTEYNTERYRFSKGEFVGAAWGPDTATPDGAAAAFFLFNSAGSYSFGQDERLDELTVQARREFDLEARRELVHEIQRHHGGLFLNNKIGTASSFGLSWPVIRNFAVHRAGTNWMCVTTNSGLRAWIDPTQAPLA